MSAGSINVNIWTFSKCFYIVPDKNVKYKCLNIQSILNIRHLIWLIIVEQDYQFQLDT